MPPTQESLGQKGLHSDMPPALAKTLGTEISIPASLRDWSDSADPIQTILAVYQDLCQQAILLHGEGCVLVAVYRSLRVENHRMTWGFGGDGPSFTISSPDDIDCCLDPDSSRINGTTHDTSFQIDTGNKAQQLAIGTGLEAQQVAISVSTAVRMASVELKNLYIFERGYVLHRLYVVPSAKQLNERVRQAGEKPDPAGAWEALYDSSVFPIDPKGRFASQNAEWRGEIEDRRTRMMNAAARAAEARAKALGTSPVTE